MRGCTGSDVIPVKGQMGSFMTDWGKYSLFCCRFLDLNIYLCTIEGKLAE